MPHEQNTGQDHNLKMCNNSYEKFDKGQIFWSNPNKSKLRS